MSFEIELTPEAIADIERHKKAGSKIILQKIDRLFTELREHPASGSGKPERLRHFEVPTWSRRITEKHRLIYRIEETRVIVLVLTAWGHYLDK